MLIEPPCLASSAKEQSVGSRMTPDPVDVEVSLYQASCTVVCRV